MRYMALIYGDPASQADMAPPPAERAMNDGYRAFEQAVRDAGVRRAGDALQGVETATTVRIRGAERVVTDGPFAETTEHLAGYYVLECGDLDEAIEWAARIPGARTGSVEIRPIQEFKVPSASGGAATGAGA